MSSSEERRDALGTELVAIDYRLNEHLEPMEEWEKLDPIALDRWERLYRKAERNLLASLGSPETVAYLRAKSQLMKDHEKNIN
jgi:hypothetical protein